MDYTCLMWQEIPKILACWVLDLWKQSDENIMYPKPLSKYGWITTKNTLAIDWDSQSNMDAVKRKSSWPTERLCMQDRVPNTTMWM